MSFERLQKVYENWLNNSDPRAQSYALMGTPWPTIFFLVIYWTSLILIKEVMKNREPFKLRSFLIFYNFSQVGLSFYICAEIALTAITSNYSFTCQPVDYSDDPQAVRVIIQTFSNFYSNAIFKD
jgi:hypothetical protein